MTEPKQAGTAGSTPVHDWLRPRLLALVDEADKAGLPRQTVVAVIIDIVGAPPFDQAAAPATTQAPVGGTAPRDPLPMEVEAEAARAQAEQVSQQEFPDLPPPLL
jgi:hypothetical protein